MNSYDVFQVNCTKCDWNGVHGRGFIPSGCPTCGAPTAWQPMLQENDNPPLQGNDHSVDYQAAPVVAEKPRRAGGKSMERVQSCQACGHPASPADSYCRICGTKLEQRWKCGSCGVSVNEEDAFCRNCGSSLADLAPPEARRSVVTSDSTKAGRTKQVTLASKAAISHQASPVLVCPECGKDDNIQKVSAIVQSGTSTGYYSGPSLGTAVTGGKSVSVVGYSTMSGTVQSRLANRLSPPPKPEEGNYGCGSWLLFGVLAFVGLIGFTFLTSSAWPEFGCIVLGLAVLALAGIVAIQSGQQQRFRQEYPRWKAAVDRWQRLYYCFRDDLVFDPETKEVLQL